jgi:cell division inhibitor SepF
MARWINRASEFLGLGQDPYYEDDYDDYDDVEEVEQSAREPRSTRPRAVPGGAEPDWDEPEPGVRVVPAPSDEPPASKVVGGRSGSDRSVVRPLPSASKPTVVRPTRFDDVQKVADGFKSMQPVIVNLQGVDRDLSRRLIDFSSGLCYGLEGDMERVAEQVFLLTPKGAQVSADDRRRLEEGRVGDLDA